jgi:hypothetical protein
MRTRRSLGVVLDAKDWQFLVAHSFNGLIVQVNVREFDVFRQRFRIHRETVVLGGDGDLPA